MTIVTQKHRRADTRQGGTVTQGLRWTTGGGAQSSDDPSNGFPVSVVTLVTVLGDPVLSGNPGKNDDNSGNPNRLDRHGNRYRNKQNPAGAADHR